MKQENYKSKIKKKNMLVTPYKKTKLHKKQI